MLIMLNIQWFAKENQQSRDYVEIVSFQEVLTNTRSTSAAKPSSLINNISQSFQMRYSMTLSLPQGISEM